MVLITTNEFIQKATTEGRCQINSIMEHTNTKNKNCLCQDVIEYWGVIFLSSSGSRDFFLGKYREREQILVSGTSEIVGVSLSSCISEWPPTSPHKDGYC